MKIVDRLKEISQNKVEEYMIPEMVINTKNRQRRSNIHLIDTLRKRIK